MSKVLDEIRQLEDRANALLKLGTGAAGNRADEEGAKAEYKSLKDGLASRLKEIERRPPPGVEGWVVATFRAALRAAHIGMRAPTNTSPRSSSWSSSVQELADELSYYAATLAKGLGR